MRGLGRVAPLLLAGAVFGQEFEPLPGAAYDPAVPRLRDVVGHDFGTRITTPDEATAYARALAEASPRVAFHRYGESWQGRPLHYLVIGSPDRLANAAEVRAGMQALADPRGLAAERAASLVETLPAVTWLAYAVHGNEISGTDAALLTAYHLAAAQDEEVADLARREALVIIDPLENPDGRERFVHHFRQTVGRWPDADGQAAEHDEPWPGGRTNHYLFDMNRDWIGLTQPETAARVRAFLRWFPLVYVDLHEMGGDSSYYFPPPADPINPEITADQRRWLEVFGRNNGRWFDAMRFDYFTREVFDAFYPGYGEGWPMFHGSIGMTYEQASVRGLLLRRNDETTLTYADSVRRHFVASLATIETAARERQGLLRSFLAFRQSAAQPPADGPSAYLLPPGRDPGRTIELVRSLMQQGVEVHSAPAALRLAAVKRIDRDEAQARVMPAGTWVVRRAQPARRLVDALLSRHTPMDAAFVERAEQRRRQRRSTDIYDVTAWSLPLLWGVEAWTTHEVLPADLRRQEDAPALSAPPPAVAKLAYLVPWGSHAALRALAALWRAGVRVHGTDRPFTHDGRRYPAGTLLVKVAHNPDDLHELVVEAAADSAAEFVAVDSSWVEDGVGFGSNHVRYLPAARVALLWDSPTSSYSAGWCRFALERQIGQPVTLLRARRLSRAELDRYDVLVIPSGGGYGGVLDGAADRLRAWVRAGGTLVALGEATRWLTGEKVALLATKQEQRQPTAAGEKAAPRNTGDGAEQASPAEGGAPAAQPFDYEKAVLPDSEPPDRIPGAIVRLHLDDEHWLAAGYSGEAQAIVTTRNIYTPVKLDQGRNVAVYAPKDELVVSGLAWDDTARQLAQKAFLVHQPHGRGHVIAFADDPNFRGMQGGLRVLFGNAVLLGPGH